MKLRKFTADSMADAVTELRATSGEAVATIEPQPGTLLAAPPARRVIALVGPTGVGKTTTIVKLAARAALVERKTVAIVTLDTYRVGGEEQMRAFADLMGVPLTVVANPERLGPTLASPSWRGTASGRAFRRTRRRHEPDRPGGSIESIESVESLAPRGSIGSIGSVASGR